MVGKRRHVLVITFPAYGHIIPILELSKRIAAHHDVTFAVSSSSISEMHTKGLLQDESPIKFLPIDDGFTSALDPCDFPAFVKDMNVINAGIKKFVESLPHSGSTQNGGPMKSVDIIICELFVAASAVSCREKGITLYHFSPNALGAQLMWFNITEDYPTVPDDTEMPFGEPVKPGDPLPPMQETMKIWSQEINQSYASTRGLIINSVRELEEDAYHALSTHEFMKDKKVFALGPLLPESNAPLNGSRTENEKQIMDWLDGKPRRSVVFVSFGTLAWPHEEQIQEIAKALSNLKRPFIWSLERKHHRMLPDCLRPTENEEMLFGGEGLVVPWVPQKLVLAHQSIGVFLSHCGWNSTLESVSNGIPVVGWPMFADQLVNARFLETLGTGIMISGTGIKFRRTVPAEEIQELVDKVGGFGAELHNGPNPCYEAAQKWKMVISNAREPGGSTTENFEKFVCDLDEA